MNRPKQFQLHILEGDWASLRLGYEPQPAWAVLQRDYAAAIAHNLTEKDVESYGWTDQVLTLSSRSAEALIARFARNEEEREHPETALDQRVFIVLLNGSPLYGGIFLHPMSSMGIHYPVIYVAPGEGKLRFTLRPVHSIVGDYSAYEPGWNGIKDKRTRDLFADAGKLVP